MRTNRTLLGLAVFATLAWTAVGDVRVDTMVDPRVRSQVAALVDSLQDEGLHPEPLIQYAIEGTTKNGSPQVILTGVKRWAKDLRHSRDVLGPAATPDEVNAGAKALRAGASVDELRRFRDERLQHRYAGALNTIAHLINLKVPADTASRLLVNLALAGATDAQLSSLQADVQRNIDGGMPAGAAAVAGAVGVLGAIEASTRDGVPPGATLPSTLGTRRPADPMANGNFGRSAVGNTGEVRPPAPRGKDNKRP